MSTAPTLVLEPLEPEPTPRGFTATVGQLRVRATPRAYGFGWSAHALDLATIEVVGIGAGRDEYEAIAAALIDAKARAKRVLRSLRDPKVIELLEKAL